jgi:hypothetical protein
MFNIRSDEEIESSSTFIIWFPDEFDDSLIEVEGRIPCYGEP